MTRTRLPLVSIVMPCYNVAPYIEEALESVRRQHYRRWEVLIVDDGSTDDTANVAGAWLATWGALYDVWLFRREHHGIAASFNWAARAAHGDLLMACPADDVLDPEYLLECCAALAEQPDATVAYTNVRDFHVSTAREMQYHEPWALDYDPETLHLRNTIAGSAVFRRGLFDIAGGWPMNCPHGCEDWAFWVHCQNAGILKPVRINRNLYSHRLRADSLSSQIEPHLDEIRAKIAALHASAPRSLV